MMTAADEEEEVTFDQSTLLTNRLKPPSRRKWCLKLLKTAGVSLAFLALGLCIAIPGPTLLDLMDRVNTDTQHIAYIFTARSGGYLLGSVLGGFLFDRFDQQLLLCVILFFTCVATAAAPWCRTLVALAVMISFQGISMGFLDTGGNIYCIEIWGKNSGPYMQTLHFCFGVGAFIAPLLAKPFLSATALDPVLNASGTSSLHVHGANIPLVMPEFPHEGNDRDPREIPLELIHAMFLRELNETEDEIANVSATVLSTVNVTTTAAIRENVPPKPIKPITSDKDLSEDTADLDVTKLKQRHEEDEEPPKTNTPTTKLPSPQPNSTNSTAPSPKPDLSDVAANETTNLTDSIISPDTTMSNASAVLSSSTTTALTPTTSTSTPTTSTSTPTSSSSAQTTTTTTTLSTTTTAVTTNPTSATKLTTPTDTQEVLNVTQITASSASPATVTNGTTASPRKPSHTVDEIVHDTIEAIKNMSSIQFAYLIIAAFLLLSSLLFMALYCWEKRESVLTRLHEDEDRGEITESRGFRIQMLILLFIFYFMYVGMEVTFGGFVMTFAVQSFDWSKVRGAVVTAIFWGALASGRGLAIFVARCCRPSVMLVVNLALSLTAALILSFAVKPYHFMLWPGTLVFGLGLSSIFPTGLSWAERYMKLTGKATAVMVVGSALGEMFVPVVTGYFFQVLDLMALMYTMLTLSAIASVLFVIMQKLASNRGDRYSVSKFLQLDDGESMEMVDRAEDVNIFDRNAQPSKQKRVKFNLSSNGTAYKPLRSSEEE